MPLRHKRLLLAKTLERLRLLPLLRRVQGPSLVVVNYHRIYSGEIETPFDERVFEASAEDFDAQVTWLKRDFDPLAESELIDYARSGDKFRGRHVLITFDDAYIDNYELAYPILKRHDMPAIFFVATAITERRRLGWWDLISYYVKSCQKTAFVLGGDRYEVGNVLAVDATTRDLLRRMKSLGASATRDLVADLARAVDVRPPSEDVQSSELMTWEQLREVSRNGVAIGSHTHSHRVLATLPLDEQRLELEGSRTLLERELGVPVRTLAYPVGGVTAFSDETKQIAREVGYKASFAFYGGSSIGRIVDPFAIPRVSPPQQISLYKATLSTPNMLLL